MLKWTASAQRLNEMQQEQDEQGQRQRRRQRRHRRATIANKENVPDWNGYTSTPLVGLPLPGARLRNSPLVLAPLSDIRNVTPEAHLEPAAVQRVQSVRYATTLPRFAEDYSPNGLLLPSGQHLALRGLAPLDPFLGQPRYMAAGPVRETKRKLDADLLATMEETPLPKPAQMPTPPPAPTPAPVRPITPQPASTQMGDQTLDRLIDAILDSACKAKDGSAKKKPRRCRSTFNLRRRTLVKQQLDADCARPEVLSPSYAPGDDPASDLSFGLMPMMPLAMTTPEPASPLVRIPHQVLVQLPTPKVTSGGDNTFCLETPVRSLKRSRAEVKEVKESPLKRYKVDERNYFEVGLALPSSIYV